MLNFRKLNGYTIAVILLFVILSMFLKMCELERESNSTSRSLREVLKEKKDLENFIDLQGRNNAKQDVIELPKSEQNLIKENKPLTKLETKVVFTTITNLDTIRFSLTDTIYVEQEDTMPIKKFRYFDRWLSMGGKIENNIVSFDSLRIVNQYNIEIGKERKWFLGKEKRVIYIRDENPHSNTTDVTSFVINEDKKWFQRDGIKYGLGGVAMFFLLR